MSSNNLVSQDHHGRFLIGKTATVAATSLHCCAAAFYLSRGGPNSAYYDNLNRILPKLLTYLQKILLLFIPLIRSKQSIKVLDVNRKIIQEIFE